jgi:hypothetical protein
MISAPSRTAKAAAAIAMTTKRRRRGRRQASPASNRDPRTAAAIEPGDSMSMPRTRSLRVSLASRFSLFSPDSRCWPDSPVPWALGSGSDTTPMTNSTAAATSRTART